MNAHYTPWEAFVAADPRYYTDHARRRFAAVQALLAGLPGEDLRGEHVLELGPHRLPLISGSDTMDKNPDLAGITFPQDFRLLPWSIPAGRYRLAIALETIEHVGNADAAKVFAELARVARYILISAPYHWPQSRYPGHAHRTDADFNVWTAGARPHWSVLFDPDTEYPVKLELFDGRQLGGNA